MQLSLNFDDFMASIYCVHCCIKQLTVHKMKGINIVCSFKSRLDWLTELWFYNPSNTKQVISEMILPANLFT